MIATDEKAASVPSATVPPDTSAKSEVFDRYWQTRELRSADRRAAWRTATALELLGDRRGRLLDVGCGRGLTAARFAAAGFDVTAVDVSPQAVAWAREQGVRAELCDLEQHAPPGGPFDVILCLEVLQQTMRPVEALGTLREALTPDGRMIVSLPNEFHIARRLQILSGRVNFGGIDDTHVKLYTIAEHRRLLSHVGLTSMAGRLDSIVPSGWSGLHRLGNSLANVWPAGLALSAMYMAKRAPGVPGHGGAA